MARKVFGILERRIGGLHEAAYLIALLTLGSQVLALFRDRLLAASFGAGEVLDVYYTAFRIPDIIFAGIASLVSVYVLIPFIAEREGERGALRGFLGHILSAFLIGIGVVSAAVWLALPALNEVLFPSLAQSVYAEEFLLLTRLLLLQPILLGLSSLIGSVVQTRGRFILFAVSPLLYNLGIIAGILFFYPLFGIAGLGLGVVAGAAAHFLVQIPYIVREGLLPLPRFPVDLRIVMRVVRLSLPRTLALAADKIVLLVLTVIAAAMASGSVAVFNLAFNLYTVPLALIGISYSVAAFPTLARLFSQGDRTVFLSHITSAVRHILFWSVPAIVFFIVLRAHIVRVIYGAGEFGWTETRLVAACVALLMLSLAAQALTLLLVRGYYAAGRTRRPVGIVFFGSLATMALAAGLTYAYGVSDVLQGIIDTILRTERIPGARVLLLPLAFSLGALLTSALLYRAFVQDFGRFFGVGRVLRESALASAALGVVIYVLLRVLGELFETTTALGLFGQGFVAGALGIAAGGAVLFLFRSPELLEVWGALRGRFAREIIAPEDIER